MIDPLTNQTYAVMTDANGNYVCSNRVPAIGPKSKATLWAKFVVPATVQRVSVAIPRFPPIEAVPIARDTGQ